MSTATLDRSLVRKLVREALHHGQARHLQEEQATRLSEEQASRLHHG